MGRATDEMLDRHQRQCDFRYVQWLWLGGILVTLLLGAGSAGWLAAQTVADVRAETGALMDSVVVTSVRMGAQDRRIAHLEVRAQVLDSLAVWVPRIEHTADEIQAMVRRGR